MYQKCENTCGTCMYLKYNKEIYGFICNNSNSENYSLPVAYNDVCELQEDKI